MQNVGLLFCGAVLFLNGLHLLGRIDGKSAGVFNLFLGGLQVVTPFYVIFTANNDPWVIFNASGVFLFSLTYLFVGITNLKSLDTGGLGWFSLWVAIMAVGYGAVSFIHFGDPKMGIIWIMWAFLWTLFFILLGLKKEIASYTGWITLILAFITATIPGFLMLVGLWESVRSEVMWGVGILFILTAFILYYRTRPQLKSHFSAHEATTG